MITSLTGIVRDPVFEAITANASAINAITDLTGITGIVAVSGGNALGRTLTAGAGIAITNANGTEGNPTFAVSLSGTTIHVAKVSASSYCPFS